MNFVYQVGSISLFGWFDFMGGDDSNGSLFGVSVVGGVFAVFEIEDL